MAAIACLWGSHATARASSDDSSFRPLKWSQVAQVLYWNSDQGSILEAPVDLYPGSSVS